MKEKEKGSSLKPKLSIELSLSRVESVILLTLPFLAFIMITFLYLNNPIKNSIFPKCIFLKYTGLYCPGCGGTRATYYLIHGNIVKALDYNCLFVFLLPFMFYLYILTFGIKYNGRPLIKVTRFSLNFCIGLGVIIVGFCILRNIPVYPFRYLAP